MAISLRLGEEILPTNRAGHEKKRLRYRGGDSFDYGSVANDTNDSDRKDEREVLRMVIS